MVIQLVLNWIVIWKTKLKSKLSKSFWISDFARAPEALEALAKFVNFSIFVMPSIPGTSCSLQKWQILSVYFTALYQTILTQRQNRFKCSKIYGLISDWHSNTSGLEPENSRLSTSVSLSPIVGHMFCTAIEVRYRLTPESARHLKVIASSALSLCYTSIR